MGEHALENAQLEARLTYFYQRRALFTVSHTCTNFNPGFMMRSISKQHACEYTRADLVRRFPHTCERDDVVLNDVGLDYVAIDDVSIDGVVVTLDDVPKC